MVVDTNNPDSINTALLLIQRRLDRLRQAIEQFNQQIKTVETIEDIRKLELKI